MERIANARKIEITHRSSQRQLIFRKRHHDAQPAPAKRSDGECVVHCRVIEKSHRGFLRALQCVRRREEIEHQHVQPPLPHIARLFRRERRVIDGVEIFDGLPFSIDEELEIFARQRRHRRGVRADVDRHFNHFDGGSLAQLGVRGGGDEENDAPDALHGTVSSMRAKPIDVVPAMRAIAFAT